MTEKKPFKLNLGALKKDIKDVNVEKTDNISSENKVSEVILDVKNSKILEKNRKAHSLDLSKMKSKKEHKINIKKEEEITNDKIQKKEIIEEKIIEEKEVFSNYESDFNKDKDSILEKVRKFKNFVKPKTRIGFILFLILVTLITILLLFIINPKVHNIENYKMYILKAKQNLECKIDKNKCKKEEIKEENDKKKIEENPLPGIPTPSQEQEATKENISNKNIKLKKLQEFFNKNQK